MSNKDLPLVSVVTPAYNQADFLRDTLESVLSQDYPNIEHQVIDDGSTDSTPEILKEYADRIFVESHQNRGQTSTINKGWERAKGDIVTWLNSDDTFLPGAVSTAVNYFEEHPDVDIVFGDTLFTQADGTPIEPSKKRAEFDYRTFVVECANPIAQPSAFIRRKVIDDVGLLDPKFYYFMDWDFWLRAGLHHRIEYFPGLYSTYRLHKDSKTVAQANKAAPELQYMYRKFFARDDLPDEVRAWEPRAMSNMFFTSAGYYLEGKNPKDARQMAWKALQSDPGAVLRPESMRKFVYCMSGGRGRTHWTQQKNVTELAADER
ncbi:MAG TPA: glycosyltransferase family 2 protein [Pyrinomonadaceae bacterium]|nr:glycosyltransferase family 2 protein [Pyrinomonadaceae bacterium]